MSGIINQRGFNRSGIIGPAAPTQPYFKYRADGNDNQGITAGDDVIIDFTTLITNTGGHYDGTNTFTAPVTGVYLFCGTVMCDNADVDHTYMQLKLHTSNLDAFEFAMIRPTHVFNADTSWVLNGSHITDMDANDTAFLEVRFTDGHNASNVSDNSYFMGTLL